MIDPARPAPLYATKQKFNENLDKFEVHAWAVMTSEKKIVAFVSGFDSQAVAECNAYKEKGFYVVRLLGELSIPEEFISLKKSEIVNVLDGHLNRDSVNSILKKLGYERGIK
jgi:hypothetical protein